jgi:hypothetical protein
MLSYREDEYDVITYLIEVMNRIIKCFDPVE